MTTDAFYLLRRNEPPTGLKDLDEVVLLRAVKGDDAAAIPAGTDGTVVGVVREGFAYVVEFTEPPGSLATVVATDPRRAADA